MVRKNLFMVKISRHGRESVSNMSSGENCGLALHLANQELSKKEGSHGEVSQILKVLNVHRFQVYFITDGETVGQYSVWSPLIKALGKTPPHHFVSCLLVSTFVSLSSYLCYKIFNSSPPMTRFELEVLITDNTYSIEKARRELGYCPEQNLFEKVNINSI